MPDTLTPEEVLKIWNKANNLCSGMKGEMMIDVKRLCVEYSRHRASNQKGASSWKEVVKKIEWMV